MKECKCLEIIKERLTEISRKGTPMEAMEEKDFYEMQGLLKIYKKISEQKWPEKKLNKSVKRLA